MANSSVSNLDDSGPGSLRTAFALRRGMPKTGAIPVDPALSAGMLTLTGGRRDIAGVKLRNAGSLETGGTVACLPKRARPCSRSRPVRLWRGRPWQTLH